MGTDRFRVPVAVYGVLTDEGRVLLLRRAGSGYHDGELSLPAGHLDGGEGALIGLLRELREELRIDPDRDSCRLALLLHRAPESADDDEYVDLIFSVDRWAGTLSIGEPDKCSELVWADRAHLPSDVVDYVRSALQALADDTACLPGRCCSRRHTAPRDRLADANGGYSSMPRMSAAVSAPDANPSLSITLPNSAALVAFNAMTFSSTVSLATSR